MDIKVTLSLTVNEDGKITGIDNVKAVTVTVEKPPKPMARVRMYIYEEGDVCQVGLVREDSPYQTLDEIQNLACFVEWIDHDWTSYTTKGKS